MKNAVYNAKARKKPTNLSINSDLLSQARALNINLSQTLEERLSQLILEHKRKGWKKENREAIKAYNRRIEKYGAFSDGLRRF